MNELSSKDISHLRYMIASIKKQPNKAYYIIAEWADFLLSKREDKDDKLLCLLRKFAERTLREDIDFNSLSHNEIMKRIVNEK